MDSLLDLRTFEIWTPWFPNLRYFTGLLYQVIFPPAAVVRSKCPSYVGTTGILVQEFKHVFKIITKDNKVKGWSRFI